MIVLPAWRDVRRELQGPKPLKKWARLKSDFNGEITMAQDDDPPPRGKGKSALSQRLLVVNEHPDGRCWGIYDMRLESGFSTLKMLQLVKQCPVEEEKEKEMIDALTR